MSSPEYDHSFPAEERSFTPGTSPTINPANIDLGITEPLPCSEIVRDDEGYIEEIKVFVGNVGVNEDVLAFSFDSFSRTHPNRWLGNVTVNAGTLEGNLTGLRVCYPFASSIGEPINVTVQSDTVSGKLTAVDTNVRAQSESYF